MRSPALLSLAAVVLLLSPARIFASDPAPTPASTELRLDEQKLNASIDLIAPEIKKWAVACIAKPRTGGGYDFLWIDYAGTGSRTDFWPASTIKLYAVIAAAELLNEKGFTLDTTIQFERRVDDRWVLDCARSMREMISEVFRRSSNEDYTLLLRMVGIDRINTHFLTPERGFPHSALMRGYVLERPYRYGIKEPQRITLRSADGTQTFAYEHTWSGRFYAEERGCTVIDSKTGNVTSPRELVECLRRLAFHEELPSQEQYRITNEQAAFIRSGGDGLTGLETIAAESAPTAWVNAVDAIFPKARFFHKNGTINNYAMDLAYVDDSANSGVRLLLLPIVNAGLSSKPHPGRKYVEEMARVIGEWARGEAASNEPRE